LFFLAKEFSGSILHDNTGIQLGKDTLSFEFYFIHESRILQAFHNELHPDLLFGVAKLIEEKCRLESESLPAIT
jgi:hypothetical protein